MNMPCKVTNLNAEVVIVDENPQMRIEMEYFWGEILGRSIEAVPSIPHHIRSETKTRSPEVLIVGKINGPKLKADFIREISSRSCTPFILSVCEEASQMEHIESLLAGANEAIQRPFSMLELGLRLRTRMPEIFSPLQDIESDLSFDWGAESLIVRQAGLTKAETRIARVLTQNAGQIVTRDELSSTIDGSHWQYGSRKFDVHVSCLRKKIGSVFGNKISIDTVRSQGYLLKFNEPIHAAMN